MVNDDYPKRTRRVISLLLVPFDFIGGIAQLIVADKTLALKRVFDLTQKRCVEANDINGAGRPQSQTCVPC